MKKLFGTDGVRGVANVEPMTADIALQIGQAVAYILRKENHRPRIVIGKDTRLSGYMIENALVAGISSMGSDTILVGPIPTPGIAFLTTNFDADAGIMISASHNPFEDNGIKIFSKNGCKLTDQEEERLEKLIFSGQLPSFLSSATDIGHVYREDDAVGRYIVFLKHSFPKHISLEGVKIVLDCAHGATYKIAPTLFREMRAVVTAFNVTPDGKNINANCGALHPEHIAKEVLESKADIGLVFDGDGDRFIAIDEKGQIVSGDTILAICAKSMKEEGRLSNNLVVSTVMSNLGLSQAMEEKKINYVKTKVGDRYVLEEMLKQGAVLGGEDSGHLIFLEHHSTGDGILTALQLLSIMKKEKKPLSELAKVMTVFPQVLINIDVNSKPPIDSIPEIKQVIEEAERELGSKGRVLVRYSGTQSLCRVMVEGPTQELTEQLAKKISAVIQKTLA